MTFIRVVEDDRVIADLLRMLLEHEGFTVAVTAEDFPLLLAPTLWEQVDTAIVDLQLNDPHINGVEILEYLTEHHPSVRRVVLSAVSDIPNLIQALGPVADVVLRKPTDIAEIVKQVRGD